MKSFLGIDITPPTPQRLFKTANKVKRKLPTDINKESIALTELSLVKDIHAKSREASQSTDLDKRKILGKQYRMSWKLMPSHQQRLMNA